MNKDHFQIISNYVFYQLLDCLWSSCQISIGASKIWTLWSANDSENFFYLIPLAFNFHGWTKITSKSWAIMFLSTMRLSMNILSNISSGLQNLTSIISEWFRQLFYLFPLAFNFHGWLSLIMLSNIIGACGIWPPWSVNFFILFN